MSYYVDSLERFLFCRKGITGTLVSGGAQSSVLCLKGEVFYTLGADLESTVALSPSKALRFSFLSFQFFPFNFLKIIIYLAVLGLSLSRWDLVPWSGIEPGPSALGAQSLSHQNNEHTHWCLSDDNDNVLGSQSCPTLCNPMDCIPPGFMGFFRQEYWSGLPFPSPGYLPNTGIEPRSPALQKVLYGLSHQGR